VYQTVSRPYADTLSPLRVSPEPQQRPKVGRPRVRDRPGFLRDFRDILERISAGGISKRQAALALRIGHATLLRLLEERCRGDLVERRGTRALRE